MLNNNRTGNNTLKTKEQVIIQQYNASIDRNRKLQRKYKTKEIITNSNTAPHLSQLLSRFQEEAEEIAQAEAQETVTVSLGNGGDGGSSNVVDRPG